MPRTEDTPFFMDSAVELPEHMEVEAGNRGQDCVTWLVSGCDDD